jgi:DNA-binding transcriptional ArsR family regulator
MRLVNLSVPPNGDVAAWLVTTGLLCYCSTGTVHACSRTVKQVTQIDTSPGAVDKVAVEKVKAVDLETVDVLTVLHALSDPVRLEIVRQLAGCAGSSELKCGQVEIPVTKSTASHHFKTLYEAGIVSAREQGTSKYIRLRRAELDERFPGLFDSVLRAVAA